MKLADQTPAAQGASEAASAPAPTPIEKPKRTQDHREFEATLRRALDLNDADRLRLMEVLSQDAASSDASRAGGEEAQADREARQRLEALAALRMVQAHLGRAEDAKVTPREFDQVAEDLGLDWNSARVVRIWERWRLAIQALVGERVPPSPTRRVRRREIGGGTRTHEEYLTAIRTWLASEPASHSFAAYDAFVAEHDETRGEGEPPLPRYHAVRLGLNLHWPTIVDVAAGQITLAEATEQAIEAIGNEEGQETLIGRTTVARLLGRGHSHVGTLTEHTGFPKPVARLYGHRYWRRGDIAAYGEGLPFTDRKEGASQAEVLDSGELAELLGLTRRVLRSRMWEERWDVLPPPSGHDARYPYWRRAAVEAWLAERGRETERAEALAAVGQVARHLRLRGAKAPTAGAFNAACLELGLEWRSARAIDLWGTWAAAREAYLSGRRTGVKPGEARAPKSRTGEQDPTTTRARGRRERDPEAHLTGVRRWLTTGPVRESMAAYDRWVADGAEGGDKAPPPGGLVCSALALGWATVVAVSKGELTLEAGTARDLAAAYGVTGDGPLAGLAMVARVLGVSVQHARTLAEDGRLPVSVATIAGHRAWLMSEIREYADGGAVAVQAEDRMAREYMDTAELAALLEMRRGTLVRWLRLKRWDRIPKPGGSIGKGLSYWRRDGVRGWREQT